jgi:hypothetical protein
LALSVVCKRLSVDKLFVRDHFTPLDLRYKTGLYVPTVAGYCLLKIYDWILISSPFFSSLYPRIFLGIDGIAILPLWVFNLIALLKDFSKRLVRASFGGGETSLSLKELCTIDLGQVYQPLV